MFFVCRICFVCAFTHLHIISMAIYCLNFGHGSRGQGNRALERFRYIARQQRYEERANHLRHLESGNMPFWAASPQYFWNSVDTNERPYDARLYSEFTVSLPRELTLHDQLKLVRSFVEKELTHSFPFTFAIHESPSLDGKKNPHAHILFSPRKLDGIVRDEHHYFLRSNRAFPDRGGTPKDRTWMKKSHLLDLRVSWQEITNQVLVEAGRNERIDHRSRKEQELSFKIPEPKLRPYDSMLWHKGIETQHTKEVKNIRAIRWLTENLERTQDLISQSLSTVKKEHDQLRSQHSAAVKNIRSALEVLEAAQNHRDHYTARLTKWVGEIRDHTLLQQKQQFAHQIAKLTEVLIERGYARAQKLHEQIWETRQALDRFRAPTILEQQVGQQEERSQQQQKTQKPEKQKRVRQRKRDNQTQSALHAARSEDTPDAWEDSESRSDK